MLYIDPKYVKRKTLNFCSVVKKSNSDQNYVKIKNINLTSIAKLWVEIILLLLNKAAYRLSLWYWETLSSQT